LASLLLVAAAAMIIGVAVGSGGGSSEKGSAPATADRPAAAKRQRSLAAGLSLEQQVGQLLVMSFGGTTAPAYITRRLRAGQGTGVILFAKNAPDAGTLRALTRSLQRGAGGEALVATDQEGGSIRSVPFAGSGARELRRLGINVNLAPVADVAGPGSVMAGRAFPGDAREVGRLTAASVRALGRGRVGATVKHFPGLGLATANTDDQAVTVDASQAELERESLPPFRAAIGAGVPLVMASHALYPAYDPDRIASQSPAVLEDLLRRRLGFRGAVVTDSLEAQAVLSRSDVATAAERSVAAGADLVLMTGSGSWNEVQPRLLRRARTDPRFRARVQEAAGRVVTLKRKLGLRPPGAA
jgi:beta-N-acetylhexosaminidase